MKTRRGFFVRSETAGQIKLNIGLHQAPVSSSTDDYNENKNKRVAVARDDPIRKGESQEKCHRKAEKEADSRNGSVEKEKSEW